MELVDQALVGDLLQQGRQEVRGPVEDNEVLNIPVILVQLDLLLLELQYLIHGAGCPALAEDVPNPAEHALQPMDGLGDYRVYGVVLLNVQLPHYFHLERVQVDVQGQQVEGEVLDVDVLHQVGALKKLFGGHGALGPEDRVELPSGRLLHIHHYEVPQLLQVIGRWTQKYDDLVEIGVYELDVEPGHASVLGHLVLPEGLSLDDEVDGDADCVLEHEQLAACDLHRGTGTESSREISLDLRYSLKMEG